MLVFSIILFCLYYFLLYFVFIYVCICLMKYAVCLALIRYNIIDSCYSCFISVFIIVYFLY